jgi:uncharacterized protein
MRPWLFNAQGHLRNGWKILAFMTVSIGCFIAVGLSRGLIPPAIKHYLPNIAMLVAAVLLVSAAVVRLEGTSLASIGIKPDGHFVAQLGTGFAGGAVLILLTAAGVWLFGGFDLVRTPQATVDALVKSAATFLGVAIFEELVFRGYAFQRAIRGIGLNRALLLFAALFCAGHLPGNTGIGAPMLTLAMLNIFLAACMLSYCYLRTGSLALPIGLHWGWNWAQGALGFGISGTEATGWWTPVFHGHATWLTGGEFGLEASVIATLVEGLAVVALMRWKGSFDAAREDDGPSLRHRVLRKHVFAGAPDQ